VELLLSTSARAPESSKLNSVSPLGHRDRQGYAALIEPLLNSEEYINNFGEDIVPYLRVCQNSAEGRSQKQFQPQPLRSSMAIAEGDRQVTRLSPSQPACHLVVPITAFIPLRSTAATWIQLNARPSAYRIVVTSQTFGKPSAVSSNDL